MINIQMDFTDAKELEYLIKESRSSPYKLSTQAGFSDTSNKLEVNLLECPSNDGNSSYYLRIT